MQNTFSQSGNDSICFLKKSFFRIGMWNSRPPPPSWKKNILNFHFDYLPPSLNRDKKMFKRAMEKLVRKDANTQKTLLG